MPPPSANRAAPSRLGAIVAAMAALTAPPTIACAAVAREPAAAPSPAPQRADPEAQAAFRDLIRTTRARGPFKVEALAVVEVGDGRRVRRSEPVEATLRFDPRSTPPRALLSLRGFEILLHDGRIDVRHASNAQEYVSLADGGSPCDALLAEFLDLPFPHLALLFGGDDPELVASRLAPRAPGVVPAEVEVVTEAEDDLPTDAAPGRDTDAGSGDDGAGRDRPAGERPTRERALRRLRFTGDGEALRLDVDPATNALTAMRLDITGGAMVDDGASLRVHLRFDEAPLPAEEAAETLAFDPGPRRRIDSVAALPRATEGAAVIGAGAGAVGDSPLVGRPAPELSLPELDGGLFELASLRGRSVVVIDFWATWCPPCRAGLPKLDATVQRLADRGVPVTAVAVNTLEGATGEALLRKVRGFWTSRNLTIAAALDEDGSAAAAWGVEALPTTVVVGLDGIVHWRHTGLTATWEQDLEAAVDAALKPFGGRADLQPIPERPRDAEPTPP